MQSFRTAAELAPNSPEVHYNRANVLRELRRLPEARRAYGQSLRANSAFALSLVNLSAMELEQGRADAALELLLRARQAEPGWAGEIHRRLGIARGAQGDSGGAEREYLAAIEFDESSAETHYNLANLYYNTGRSEQAARHYERALDLAPTSRKIYFNLADAYCAVGRYADAEEVSDRGLRLAPSEVKLYYTLGVAQEGLGKLDAAIASYERFIASARESAAVMKNVKARLRDLKIAAPSR